MSTGLSTEELVAFFHHRWAPPTLALLGERGGARFVELQRKLAVGSESLRSALGALIDLGYVERNPGYGHPLRPEYVVTARGREVGAVAGRILTTGDPELLLRKWSVPVLAALAEERRFSELRAALAGVTPRALALALRELEAGSLVRRTVLPTRPPSTLYRVTAAGRRITAPL